MLRRCAPMPAGFALATHKWHPPPQLYKDPLVLPGTGPEDKAKLKKTFRQLDVNRDGRLTFNELKQLLHRGQPGMEEHEMRILFKHVDRDRSGCIDFDEFVDFIFSSSLEDRGDLSCGHGHRVDTPLPDLLAAPQSKPASANSAPVSAVSSRRSLEGALPHALHTGPSRQPPSEEGARARQDPLDLDHPVVARRRSQSPQPSKESPPRRTLSQPGPPRLSPRQISQDAADCFGIVGHRAEMHEPPETPGSRRDSGQRSRLRGESRENSQEPVRSSVGRRRSAPRPRTVSRGRAGGTI